MPAELARRCIQRKYAVCVEVGSFSIAAVEAVGGIAGRQNHDPAFSIDVDQSPETGPGAILPAIGAPGFGSGFFGLRDRMKLPDEFAGSRVEGAGIAAWSTAWTFLRAGAHDDEIAIDRRRRGHAIACSGKTIGHAGPEVDLAIVAKCRNRFARCRHRAQSGDRRRYRR